MVALMMMTMMTMVMLVMMTMTMMIMLAMKTTTMMMMNIMWRMVLSLKHYVRMHNEEMTSLKVVGMVVCPGGGSGVLCICIVLEPVLLCSVPLILVLVLVFSVTRCL